MDEQIKGAVAWLDLTVASAEKLRDFYEAVVGWKASPVAMEDYEDFNMIAGDGEPAAGICHARGPNAKIPPQWIPYILVEDLKEAKRLCLREGGEIILEPESGEGQGGYAFLRDPAGAAFAVYEMAKVQDVESDEESDAS